MSDTDNTDDDLSVIAATQQIVPAILPVSVGSRVSQ